jgi:hypothetical protein
MKLSSAVGGASAAAKYVYNDQIDCHDQNVNSVDLVATAGWNG